MKEWPSKDSDTRIMSELIMPLKETGFTKNESKKYIET